MKGWQMERIKTVGVYDQTSDRIGFHEWDLAEMDEFKDLINRILKEGFSIATEQYKCHAWLGAEWDFGENPSNGAGGPPPTDAMTIMVELPLGPNDYDNPRWIFSLCDIVDQMIEGCAGDSEIAKEHVRSATAIRDGLRSLADKIDARMPKTLTEEPA